jgi:hypothetical protein
MAKQLHIFLENRPGRLESIAQELSKSKINVIAFTIQDKGDFGLTKLLVDDPKRAESVLKEKGFACALKDIVLVSVKDKIGNFHTLTKIVLKNKINIADAHGFVASGPTGICALEVKSADIVKVEKILKKSGFSIIETEDLVDM